MLKSAYETSFIECIMTSENPAQLIDQLLSVFVDSKKDEDDDETGNHKNQIRRLRLILTSRHHSQAFKRKFQDPKNESTLI